MCVCVGAHTHAHALASLVSPRIGTVQTLMPVCVCVCVAVAVAVAVQDPEETVDAVADNILMRMDQTNEDAPITVKNKMSRSLRVKSKNKVLPTSPSGALGSEDGQGMPSRAWPGAGQGKAGRPSSASPLGQSKSGSLPTIHLARRYVLLAHSTTRNSPTLLTCVGMHCKALDMCRHPCEL